MKFAICALAILSPASGWAQLAGNWAGATEDAQGAHRIVLHISGPFTSMKASADIAEQKLVNAPVDSIALLDSTLEFSMAAADIRYSGVLNDSGVIVGTLTQHGVGVPLMLARVAAVAAYPPDVVTQGSAVVESGHYVHKPSGVEFDLPAGWSLDRTQFSNGSRGESSIIDDRSGKAMVISVNIAKVHTDPEAIPKVLAQAVPRLVAMRGGDGPPRQIAPNYKIRAGSVQQTTISGRQAVRAIGEYMPGDKSIAELLAWIDTEQTRTYFFLRTTADDLAAEQVLFDQWLQSAKIP
jgi:hypothetical protein